MMRYFKYIVVLYLTLLLIFTGAMVTVYLIPTKAIANQVKESTQTIEQEGIFWKPLGIYLLQIDNMTDCMMMNIAAYAETERPVESAMLNDYGYDQEGSLRYMWMAKDTWKLADVGPTALAHTFRYARYWHGYQTILRPLLTIFNYRQLRIVNYVLLLFLSIMAVWLIDIRVGWVPSLLFVVSLFVVSFPLVPLSFQLSTCFYLAFLGMLPPLCIPQRFRSIAFLIGYFFLLGGLTAFFDLLTTPQLVLGFPMLMVFMLHPPLARCRNVVLLSLLWLLGYASLWASKWMVCRLLTGESILQNALDSAMVRVSDKIVFGGMEMEMSDLVTYMLKQVDAIIPLPVIGSLMLLLIILSCWYAYAHRQVSRQYGWLLLVAAIVPVWFVVLKNHSFQHIFFTWRAWALPCYAISLYVYFTLQGKNYGKA